jgi:hypothetical protein
VPEPRKHFDLFGGEELAEIVLGMPVGIPLQHEPDRWQ